MSNEYDTIRPLLLTTWFQRLITTMVLANQLARINIRPARSGNEGPCLSLRLTTAVLLSVSNKMNNPVTKTINNIHRVLSIITCKT
jgi:hypothetical protein